MYVKETSTRNMAVVIFLNFNLKNNFMNRKHKYLPKNIRECFDIDEIARFLKFISMKM